MDGANTLNGEKRALVTGACGSIGSELVKSLLGKGFVVCAFDNNENGLFKLDQNYKDLYNNRLRLFVGDIRDKDRLIKAFEGVEIVYHCAALKHVYLAEYNPFEAMLTNIIGTNNVISAAIIANVDKVVYTSSDKAVNPSSTMGATKLLGERLMTAANHHSGNNKTRFASVRFGNVLNTSGSVLHIFNQQIEDGLPLTITSTEMTRFFLSMSQALDLCLYASNKMVGGEIFVRNMGCCSILSLAKAISGDKDVNYKIIGHKSGEKLYEELVTESEALRTVYKDEWYTILPDTINSMDPKCAENLEGVYGDLPKMNRSLSSDREMMSDDEVRSMLRHVGLIDLLRT